MIALFLIESSSPVLDLNFDLMLISFDFNRRIDADFAKFLMFYRIRKKV